jgi:hypothetical protein
MEVYLLMSMDFRIQVTELPRIALEDMMCILLKETPLGLQCWHPVVLYDEVVIENIRFLMCRTMSSCIIQCGAEPMDTFQNSLQSDWWGLGCATS